MTSTITQRGWRGWLEVGSAGGADPTVLTPFQTFQLAPYHWLYDRPEDQAEIVSDGWDALGLPDELCGLHIIWPLTDLISPAEGIKYGLTPEKVQEYFRAGRVDPGDKLDRLRRFVKSLRRRPRLVYTNEEGLLSRFSMPDESWLEPVFADPACRRWMPRSLDAATAGDTYRFWENNRAATTAFNGYAADIVIRSINGMVQASGLLDNGARLVQSFCCRSSRPLFDLNNWEQTQRETCSRTSNNQLYITGEGQRFEGRALPRQWNAFLDAIDNARACTDSGTGYSFCGHVCSNTDPAAGSKAWTHPWVFGQLLGHLCRTPQPSQPFRDVIVFNEFPNAAREAAIATQLIGHMSVRPAAVLNPVPLDALSVTTGQFETTFREYQANVR